MKKILLLALLFPFLVTAQTVPNGNFETWFMVSGYENPDYWVTDNTMIQTTVSKDFDAYEGDIAMRVTAQPIVVGDYGMANTEFELTAIPEALNFYAKSEVEFGSVSVTITFLNQENEVYTEEWYGTSTMTDYTLISIPLDQTEPIVTSVRIRVVAQVGDLVAGTAWISVDDMKFGEPVNVEDPEKHTFKIYPNPTSEYLTIQSSGSVLGNLKFTDAQGKVVLEKRVEATNTRIDVQRLTPGIYTIVSDDSRQRASVFIVSR